MAKFLIVEARFYDHLNDMLVSGAKAALKASFFCDIAMVTRGFETRLQILSSKRSPFSTSRWFQSRPRFYMAPASAVIFEGRMAEWLRPDSSVR